MSLGDLIIPERKAAWGQVKGWGGDTPKGHRGQPGRAADSEKPLSNNTNSVVVDFDPRGDMSLQSHK